MEHPKVVVLLPVYHKDSPFFLASSIDSMLGQTYHPLHILIGIDGQIDNALTKCIQSYSSNERITILPFKKNRGLASTLNDMIRWAQTNGYEYYARMDADDISLPNRIQNQMDFLTQHPDVDVVGGATNEIDENGCDRGKINHFPLTHDECFRYFAKRSPMAHPTVVFRQSFFDKIHELYDPSCRIWEDTNLWYKGFLRGAKLANIEEVVLNFRMTPQTAIRRTGVSYAKSMLIERNKINRDLNFGIGATIYAYLLFLFRISPTWIVRIAYKIL